MRNKAVWVLAILVILLMIMNVLLLARIKNNPLTLQSPATNSSPSRLPFSASYAVPSEDTIGARAGKTVQELQSKTQDAYQTVSVQTQKTSQELQKTSEETLKILHEEAQKANQDLQVVLQDFMQALNREMERFNEALKQKNPR